MTKTIVVNNLSSSVVDDARTFLHDYYHVYHRFCSVPNVAKTKTLTNYVDVVINGGEQRQGYVVVVTLFSICIFVGLVIFLFFIGHRRCRHHRQRRLHAVRSSSSANKNVIMETADAAAGASYDEDILACLLSSVYQPFVEIAPAVLMEAERMINVNYEGDLNKYVDDFLRPAIDLLWRLQKLTKAELSRKNKRTPIGWPLCTNRRVIVHLGQLVGDPDVFNGVQLEKGDFYVSVVVFGDDGHPESSTSSSSTTLTNDSVVVRRRPSSQFRRSTVSSRIALILYYYDGDDGGLIEFKEISLYPVDFVNLFTYLTSLETEQRRNIINNKNNNSCNLFNNIPSLSFSSSTFNRLKLRRCLSLKSNGQLEIVPLIMGDDDECRRTLAICAQNDEYFNFTKKKTDQDDNDRRKDVIVDNVDGNDVDEKKRNAVFPIKPPNFVDFTLSTASARDSQPTTADEEIASGLSTSPSISENVALNLVCDLTKQTSMTTTLSFVGRCPRKIGDVRDELMSSGCIRYTGTTSGVTLDECRQTCVVEVSLLNDGKEKCLANDYYSSLDLAKTFVYLQYVHRSSTTTLFVDEVNTKKFPLVLLVDCRSDKEVDTKAVRLFGEALDLLKTLRPNVLCKLMLIGADDSLNRMFQEHTNVTDIEYCTIDELYARIAPCQLSDEMGGERKYDGVRWTQFRKDLESFMDSCRMAAKFYINAIQRLKKVNEENSSSILWSLTLTELNLRSEKLRHDLNYTSQANATLENLFVSGSVELEKLDEFVGQQESVPHYREAVTKVSAFFDEVRRVMLKYQQSSNRFTSMLDEILQSKRVLDEINSHISWLENDAKPALQRFYCRPNGTKSCRTLKNEFDAFIIDGVVRLNVARIDDTIERFRTFSSVQQHLTVEQRDELDAAERRLSNLLDEYRTSVDSIERILNDTLHCYQLLDEAYEWALDSMKLAANIGKILNSKSKTDDDQLKKWRDQISEYFRLNPQYNGDKLATLRKTASELNDDRLKIQCQAVDVRCSETEQMLLNQKMRLDEIVSGVIDYDNTNNHRRRISSGDYEQPTSSSARFSFSAASDSTNGNNNFAQNRRRSFAGSCSSSLRDVTNGCSSISTTTFQKNNVDLYIDEKSEETFNSDVITEDFTDQVVSTISATMLRKKIAERRVSAGGGVLLFDKKKIVPISSDPPASSSSQINPVMNSASSSSLSTDNSNKFRRPFRKFIRRGSLMDAAHLEERSSQSRHPSLDSLSSVGEESHHSSSLSTKSLPFTSLETSRDSPPPYTLQTDDSPPPYPAPLLPPEADDKLRVNTPPPDCSPSMRMQYNVVNELLQTEIAYVRSLQYVIENYIPEMQRTDLPHALRGQRRPIFGNIEKIHEFHVGHFLPDLTRYCLKSTESLGLHVAKCFLRHRLKFQLYALYNKNKPHSDALISECAGVFFRTKQLLLGDKLDLWSYLLKPVQRISKYSLFVQKLIKACPSDDQEQIEALKAVEDMLMSQLQHGNDLLAMDSIRNCDLNLKEQGKLLRQEEFVVYEGRNGRKCMRRIFLFENLVLFAKPRKTRGSASTSTTTTSKEFYDYKNSIKMSDLGMTENVGDCELKFELWFRRHTSEEIYTILAPNMTVKMAWVTRVSKMLWQQAHLNRELRISEMTSMGVGSKVCVDLHSEDRIQDRAVSNGLLAKAGRSRNALPSILDVDKYNLTTKRPHSLISVGSSSSSNNSSLSGTGSGGCQQSVSATTPMSLESGIFVDLSTLEEYPDDPTTTDVDALSTTKTEHVVPS